MEHEDIKTAITEAAALDGVYIKMKFEMTPENFRQLIADVFPEEVVTNVPHGVKITRGDYACNVAHNGFVTPWKAVSND